jgi:hypothetical protein
MPAGGRFRVVTVGKEPFIFRGVVILTVTNALLGLLLPFAVEHSWIRSAYGVTCKTLQNTDVLFRVPAYVCWYAQWWIGIEFFLIACVAFILVLYRKRVRLVRASD